MIFISNKCIKICSSVSIGKNAFHKVFVQYLETEFSDLWLVMIVQIIRILWTINTS